jgi:DUF4097 and DUF4098 domain-containing protein YvlB
MNPRSLLATLAISAILAAAPVFAAADTDFDRTLNTGSSPVLSVSTGSGYIHLRPGSDSQIHIVGHIHANHGWMSSGSDVESRIRKIAANPPITQSGNQVTVGNHHNDDDFRNISINYDITLPKASTLTANSGSGDIDIQDVGTSVKAESGSGSVRARGIQGPANLQTGSGDIELHQIGPGDVRAQTGSGSIRLDGISGGLRAGTGSGDIEVNGKPTTDWKLDTGSGSIHLNVGKTTPFTVNASTGSGGVHIEQPFAMQGDVNRHHVSASVNGGGPVIKADTGSGDIHIQ